MQEENIKSFMSFLLFDEYECREWSKVSDDSPTVLAVNMAHKLDGCGFIFGFAVKVFYRLSEQFDESPCGVHIFAYGKPPSFSDLMRVVIYFLNNKYFHIILEKIWPEQYGIPR